ncbi:MAG: tetratricopeptide repeat protein [Pseudomonadota bacterium]
MSFSIRNAARPESLRWPYLLLAAAALTMAGCQERAEESTSANAKAVEQTSVADSAETLDSALQLLFDAPNRYAYPDAIEALERVIAANPGDPKANLMLIYALGKSGKYEEAKPYLKTAQQARNRLGARDQLWLAALTARVDDEKSEEPARWRLVVDKFPDDRWAWYELASSHLSLEQFAQSAEAASEALSLEPDPARWEASWIYYLHSKALFREGRFAEAAVAAEAGRDNATTWRSTYFRMAMAQAAAGQVEDVVSLVDRYREISLDEGRNNESYTEANIALFYHELGDYARAVEHARRSLELEAGAYQAWALAYCLTDNQEPLEALEVLRTAAEGFPDNPHVMASRSYALLVLGRLDEARASIQAAEAASARKNVFFSQLAARIERRASGATTGGSGREERLWLG